MATEVDVMVVGMGPGGEQVAGDLAEAGLEVVGLDPGLVGGECPYWGCVPSKMIVRAANLLAEARRVDGMAGSATVEPDWAPVARRIRDEATDHWDDTVAVERFQRKGGTFVRAAGTVAGPDLVRAADGSEYRVRRAIVLAAGMQPSIPPIKGLPSVPYWTNHEAIEAERLPESLIVVGGGAVSLELGQAFARFGTRLTVVEGLDRLLPNEEPEAGELIAEVLHDEGVDIHVGAQVKSVSGDDSSVHVELGNGTALEAARLLVATGRRVDLASLGVGAIGVDESARALPVDQEMRVTDGVWAVGDITGRGPFTHVATYQASIAVASILGRPSHAADYSALSRVTFTDPEVGAVGVTEHQAREQGLRVRVGTQQVPHTARGWLHKTGNEGFIKLVEDTARGVLVGATSVGPSGGEVLGLLSLAVHAAVPVTTLRQMIYAYPTIHRGVEDALRELT
ncbi:MAG: NAD(P)/FAD-dependent oxidoreductase [Dehalococcoidia bacterium]|nr:NAD(P)/FAD-dependent oxidoreductase [Dehalococcoidia bacterium]